MMTTETRPTVQHKPWCSAHVEASAEVGPQGWCATATEVHGAQLEIASDVETLGGQVGIEVYVPGDTWLTVAQVREVAAALLTLAETVENA